MVLIATMLDKRSVDTFSAPTRCSKWHCPVVPEQQQTVIGLAKQTGSAAFFTKKTKATDLSRP
jgi:hypothetical protein